MTPSTAKTRLRYDWSACLVAVTVGLAVAVPAGLLVARIVSSTLLLTAVVTVVGTGVSRWTYARVAKPGSRPIDDES